MSAIAGLGAASLPAPPDAEQRTADLLARMQVRGADDSSVLSLGPVTLGVSRFAWEQAVHPDGARVARHGNVSLVADATLYDTETLKRELRSCWDPSLVSSPSKLLLAAYVTWGTPFALRLNGDFAFILWDGDRNHLVAGRDFVGRRSLFRRTFPSGSIAMASRATALADSPYGPATLNTELVAASLSGLLSGSLETAYREIEPIPAGTTMSWSNAGSWKVESRWRPPRFRTGGKPDFVEGSRELRGILSAAVRDRMTQEHVAVYLSGGADSPAVFGAACDTAQDRKVHAISVSFPEGDSAREDEHIQATAQRWGVRPHWIQSESMSVFDSIEARAAGRDDVYAHTFEQMNRRLGAEALANGARVALDGHGGDLLFQVSDSCIPEILLAGHPLMWRRLLRDGNYRSFKEVLRWGLAPILPNVMWRTFDVFRERPLQRPFVQDLAGWITAPVRRRLEELAWTHPEPARGLFEGPAAYESRWYLEAPYMARTVAWTHEFAIESGVELRSPLLDRRVVEFAASRPVLERASVTETKRLLREAVRGLVPDSVLAPRPYKTGVPRGYFGRQMQNGFRAAAESVLLNPRNQVLLAELGILDKKAFEAEFSQYQDSKDHLTGVHIFLTLGAELWLRAHVGQGF